MVNLHTINAQRTENFNARVHFNRNCCLQYCCRSGICIDLGLSVDEIRHSSLLQEEFRTAVRRLIVSIGIFAIPVAVYLLEEKQSQNNAEPYAIVWGVCYVVSLLILLPSLATLIRDANRERKTGLYRFRR
jgi:hypothetical protein